MRSLNRIALCCVMVFMIWVGTLEAENDFTRQEVNPRATAALRLSYARMGWVGTQVGVPITAGWDVVAGAEVNVTDNAFCDRLFEGHLMHAFASYGPYTSYGLAGFGLHRCNGGHVSTKMVSVGAGVQVATPMTILLEVRAHIKVDRQGTWNPTHRHLLSVAVGARLF